VTKYLVSSLSEPLVHYQLDSDHHQDSRRLDTSGHSLDDRLSTPVVSEIIEVETEKEMDVEFDSDSPDASPPHRSASQRHLLASQSKDEAKMADDSGVSMVSEDLTLFSDQGTFNGIAGSAKVYLEELQPVLHASLHR
jgi:hypothetical protein